MSGICHAAADTANGAGTVTVPEGMPEAWFLSLTTKQQASVTKAGKDHKSVVAAIAKWKEDHPDNDPLAEEDDDDPLTEGTDETKDAHSIEARTVTTAAANANIAAAVDAAKIITTDQWNDIQSTVISEQKNAVLAGRLAQAWLFTRATDGKLIPNANVIGAVMSWPIPGSTRKELDAAGLPDLMPDKFSYKRQSSDSEERNVNSSFYGEEYDASPAGKENAALLEDIRAALGTDISKLTPRAQEYRKVFMASLGEASKRQTQEAETVVKRRTRAIGYIRQAVKCVRLIQTINSTKELVANNVRATFTTELDQEGKSLTVSPLAKPCKVFSLIPDPTTGAMRAAGEKPFTIPTFVRLNVAKAVANGGTLDALVATVAKAPRTGGKKGDGFKQATLPVGSIVAFELTSAAFAQWLDDAGNYQLALKAMTNPQLVSDAFVDTLTMLHQSIGGLLQARPKMVKATPAIVGKVQAAAAASAA